jgi:hypothetical protein
MNSAGVNCRVIGPSPPSGEGKKSKKNYGIAKLHENSEYYRNPRALRD